MHFRCALLFLICLAANGALADVRIAYKPQTNKPVFQGYTSTIWMLDKAGKRSARPIAEARSVVKATVVSGLPDGTTKVRLQPVAASLNGKTFSKTEQLGGPVTIKVNKFGKLIGVELPRTRATPARAVDLQPYTSKSWRSRPWLPDRPLKRGESWTIARGDSKTDKSYGDCRITLASEGENVAGLKCCRFDSSGNTSASFQDAMGVLRHYPKLGMPTAAADKCLNLAKSLSGQTSSKSQAKCWIEPKSGSVVAARSTSTSRLLLKTDKKFGSRTYDYVFQNDSAMRVLEAAEASSFVACTDEPQPLMLAAVDMQDPLARFGLKSAPGYTPYMVVTAGIGLSMQVPLLSFGPCVSFEMNVRSAFSKPEEPLANAQISLGLQLDVGVPLISAFAGTGFDTGDFDSPLTPGDSSWGTSVAVLCIGSNQSPGSLELGVTPSLICIGIGATISLGEPDDLFLMMANGPAL